MGKIDLTNKCNNSKKYKGNAVIYSRVSTKNQSFGSSLDLQEEISKLYCIQNKYNIVYCVNEVCSAKIITNQKKLLDIIDNNSNIHLIICEPTRISRNLTDFTQLLTLCKQKNIIIHFVSDNLITNNTNDIKIILSSVYTGELEIKTLSNRIKKSIEHRKRNNTYLSSTPKYGLQYERKFVNNKINKIVKKNYIEQLIITCINKLYWGSDIKSINEILFTLTNETHEIFDTNNENEIIDKIEYGNMTFIDIANFLNSNNIFRRNKLWSGNSISNLIKDGFNDIDNALESLTF
jgi:DNA invertase Pin-like site-specific DNA recombinase